MKKHKKSAKILTLVTSIVLMLTMTTTSIFATINFDIGVSGNYYNIISSEEYQLAPEQARQKLLLTILTVMTVK